MTKEKILQAAINQYSLYSYHGATMRNIAQEVGIKPASIYFFYKNKESLFLDAFQKLLKDHLNQMKQILEDVHDEPILSIFEALLKGTVDYHKKHEAETNVYISLVTSPPKEIHQTLLEHIQTFDKWMTDSLLELIRRDKPEIDEAHSQKLIKQFSVILDGVFWEIKLYNDQELKQQIDEALYIMRVLMGGNEK
ncbi:TetR/AcrR family transcriptional regulator [Siminovitchia terrae]|uniref:TetR/AcrR family transcriptional regulator n=1 Tax=Siminovitchia terrae TaxID=1914933 RepID=UPI00136C5D10|nr:TetR/AcrR family transcriptional regulator [Siminovitchia terrae]